MGLGLCGTCLRVGQSGGGRGGIVKDRVERRRTSSNRQDPDGGVAIVGSAWPNQRRYLVGIREARFAPIAQLLDLEVEMSQMLVVQRLRSLRQGDLLLGELLGACVTIPYRLAQLALSRVVLMAAIRPYPALDLIVALLDRLDAVVIRAVFVGDLVLNEANLFGEIGHAVEELLEDDGGVLRLDGRRHLLYEVY